MRLSVSPITEIASSEGLEAKEYGLRLEDLKVVFNILSTRTYKNPKRVICREYISNARDAHREAGCPEKPVEVTFPTLFEPFLKIQDFGPGISVTRMDKIFCSLAASSKRGDDKLTGGFGIGAKSAFSYTTQFQVETNVGGVKYIYAMFISENKLPACSLLDKVSTTDPNGTTVSIPIQTDDIKDFTDYTKETIKYWEPRPIIKNPPEKFDSSTPNLRVLTGRISVEIDENRYGQTEVVLLLDSIPYPIERWKSKLHSPEVIKWFLARNYVIFVKTGEIDIPAHRESLFYDDATVAFLDNTVKIITDQINALIENTVVVKRNIQDAMAILCTHSFPSDVMCSNGLSINKYRFAIPDSDIAIVTFSHGKRKYSSVNGLSSNCVTTKLIFNDKTNTQISKAKMRIITGSTNSTHMFITKLKADSIEFDLALSYFQTTPVSAYNTVRVAGKKSYVRTYAPKNELYLFKSESRPWQAIQTTIDYDISIIKGKYYFALDNLQIICGTNIQHSELENICNILKHNKQIVYGVPERNADDAKAAGGIDLMELIVTAYAKLQNVPHWRIYGSTKYNMYPTWCVNIIESLITKNHAFNADAGVYINSIKARKSLMADYASSLIMLAVGSEYSYDGAPGIDGFSKAYPLIQLNHHIDDRTAIHIKNYIIAIDSAKAAAII